MSNITDAHGDSPDDLVLDARSSETGVHRCDVGVTVADLARRETGVDAGLDGELASVLDHDLAGDGLVAGRGGQGLGHRGLLGSDTVDASPSMGSTRAGSTPSQPTGSGNGTGG